MIPAPRQYLLSAFLLLLLITQAASQICGAQCLQHSSSHSQTCHAMQLTQHQVHCQAHTSCAPDLAPSAPTNLVLIAPSGAASATPHLITAAQTTRPTALPQPTVTPPITALRL